MPLAKPLLAALAFTVTTFAGCYGPREAQDDKEKTFRHYGHLLNCNSGRLFGKDKAQMDYDKNAKTDSLGLGVRADTKGVFIEGGSRKLMYDFNHGLTFQYYDISIQCDKKQTGYRFITPVSHLSVIQDNNTQSDIDQRYCQAKKANTKTASIEELMARTSYDEETNTFVENLNFKNKMPGQLLYNMNTKDISFLCPGFEPQHVCFLDNANEQLKTIYLALDAKRSDMALKYRNPME